jgi:hypothetical protein
MQEVNYLPNPANVNRLQFDYGWPCTEGTTQTPEYTDWLQ